MSPPSGTELRFGARRFDLPHPDRVLFPDVGIRRRDLLRYYLDVAPAFLRGVRDRPLTLRCFPDGIDGEDHYRQRVTDAFPDWMPDASRALASGEGSIDRILCDSPSALAWLLRLGTISLHAGLARAPRLDLCDRMIFDLDPPGDDFEPVRDGALRLGELLRELGAHPFAMTTGSRGLHVVVPVRPRQDHDAVRDVARRIAERLVDSDPVGFTLAHRKADRGSALYLDIMRIVLGQTGVAPWSVRARPGAPVATPLRWEELADRSVHARSWTLADIPRRLERSGDPWRGIGRHAVKLDSLRRRL